MFKKLWILCIYLFCAAANLTAQELLDDFDSKAGWQTIVSDPSVRIETHIVDGKDDKALKMDFDFSKGTGYCGIQKKLPRQLPDNFSFTFWLKGNAPVNNFEFKLLDESGDNVWWLNQRNYEFHRDWRKIIIKKRNIDFAWGPAKDKSLLNIDKIQFFIASATGGSGSIWLDDFKFEVLAVPDTIPPKPIAITSSARQGFSARNIFDGNKASQWRSARGDHRPNIVIDLQKHYEYGGLIIDWDKKDWVHSYDIQISHDQQNWETVYQVKQGKSGRAVIPLKNYESRYLKINLNKSNGTGYAVSEIRIMDYLFSESPENMYRSIAAESPKGWYPRYFNDEQSYWTLTGVNNDIDEALINEDGMVEVDKSMFSLEPFVWLDAQERLLSWNDVQKSQHLEDNYLPVPSVKWQKDDLILETQIFADGPAGESVLYAIYTISNSGEKSFSGSLLLALRPFQVNPPWQFLNWPGGTAKISSIEKKGEKININHDKTIFLLTSPDDFGAADFDQGDITCFISENRLPGQKKTEDKHALASAALRYNFSLNPRQSRQVILAVPFHENARFVVDESQVSGRFEAVRQFWKEKINTVQFELPPSADRLINTLRSNLAYILINRDGFGIQPGSRSYERSWIRDGALTSSALLKLGVQQEVKDFLNWYSDYQYPNGAVPCVVDKRGPDPVPEHDSHGQLIFALMQYYLFTADRSFLENHFEHIQNAIQHMNDLTALRKTEPYVTGNTTQQACYGLMPESISHEGYSAKPMHSYWDDFFGLKGYKDAAQIAAVLGRDSVQQEFAAARDTFQQNLYRSIDRAVKNKKIDFIPGCVELGDFDATSTAIAVYPCNELKNLPQPYARNTFDRYFEYFTKRRDNKVSWHDYTPYEVRLIGTFIYLGQVERAHALIDFFFEDQRPSAWNHWAEVVRKGYRTTGFIGDMPHTWVGSDFISALRSMFVYEDELNGSLVIGKGLYRDWIDSEKGMAVKDLPTYYGKLNYIIKRDGDSLIYNLDGSLNMPAGHIILANRFAERPSAVFINDRESTDFDAQNIVVSEFPARVRIVY